MFTGIIETPGTVDSTFRNESNLTLWIRAPFTHELKIDQSISHNGICLTVTEIESDKYAVVAVPETIKRTTIGGWEPGLQVNLERGVSGNGRLDGHLVQGHVDCIGYVDRIENLGGSFQFYFSYSDPKYVTVEKGSITVNGVSLTVVDSSDLGFSVAIIPFTYENTTFKDLKRGDAVNLEFDVIGKYVSRYLEKEFSRKNKGN